MPIPKGKLGKFFLRYFFEFFFSIYRSLQTSGAWPSMVFRTSIYQWPCLGLMLRDEQLYPNLIQNGLWQRWMTRPEARDQRHSVFRRVWSSVWFLSYYLAEFKSSLHRVPRPSPRWKFHLATHRLHDRNPRYLQACRRKATWLSQTLHMRMIYWGI